MMLRLTLRLLLTSNGADLVDAAGTSTTAIIAIIPINTTVIIVIQYMLLQTLVLVKGMHLCTQNQPPPQ